MTKEKAWTAIYADGKLVGCVSESAAADREERRLSGLKGIDIKPATSEDLIRSRARTELTKGQIEKISAAAARMKRSGKSWRRWR